VSRRRTRSSRSAASFLTNIDDPGVATRPSHDRRRASWSVPRSNSFNQPACSQSPDPGGAKTGTSGGGLPGGGGSGFDPNLADGQLLSIVGNTALFSVLGTPGLLKERLRAARPGWPCDRRRRE
jgi:hypothetical protein